MADGRKPHVEGRIEALRHLVAGEPQTAYSLARRLNVSEGHARQRLKKMESDGLVEACSRSDGTTQYSPSTAGLVLLRDSTPELPAGAGVVLMLEPVVTAVRSELWRLLVDHPPLSLVRTRGQVSWMVICRSASDADELADALNLAGDSHRVSCLSVLVEGNAITADIARGLPNPAGGASSLAS
jgi:DNA-binding transcriptional ArsR family regulator